MGLTEQGGAEQRGARVCPRPPPGEPHAPPGPGEARSSPLDSDSSLASPPGREKKAWVLPCFSVVEHPGMYFSPRAGSGLSGPARDPLKPVLKEPSLALSKSTHLSQHLRWGRTRPACPPLLGQAPPESSRPQSERVNTTGKNSQEKPLLPFD